MPYQAHLFIGERVGTFDDARGVLRRLGVRDDQMPEDEEEFDEHLRDGLAESFALPERQIIYRGTQYAAIPFLFAEEFPAEEPTSDYTCALIGIPLTSRYRGAILDVDYVRGGRPEPFEINLDDAADLLRQVQEWWPTAKLLMMDIDH